ncbi:MULTISPECIES: hypothetical protein [Paenibacillus]|uniref:Uncharacterized protein n=1 Tax=Paenibacillus radicis (ex Xue et al. 2023) TaxID=2972489 RepID=A0ABT1Y9Z1_9BACL|nr:hypothetical protein [Paenibacillus radicis (ex Xue et al. 2023)]MCR8630001.1 hypothetical protein [Paenibacillus radicis (ex Xue et al. 2023)]
MINSVIKTKAMGFINQEIERLLSELERGLISKDEAIGGLNTVYNIASGIEDVKYMQTICRIIAYIRSRNYYFKMKSLYLKNYFDGTHEASLTALKA